MDQCHVDASGTIGDIHGVASLHFRILAEELEVCAMHNLILHKNVTNH
jgi:hypothetical protein